MGVYLRFLRPGRVSEVSLIGVALLLLAIVSGGWVAETDWGQTGSPCRKVTLVVVHHRLRLRRVGAAGVAAAGAARLPVDVHEGRHHRAAGGRHPARAAGHAGARGLDRSRSSGNGPVFAGSLFPFLFITIACGALSGFHSLISSGTTPKLLEKESQMRLIGYGGMLTESFVGDHGADHRRRSSTSTCTSRMNAPAGADRRHRRRPRPTTSTASACPAHRSPAARSAEAAEDVGEESIVSRTGGAPTLAFGMSEVLHEVFGGAGPQGVLVPLRDHVRGAVHPHHRRRRHPGRPVHAVRRPRQPRRAAAASCATRRWRVGAWIC